VTSAGRQMGAVLGTAILIAIVGEPETLAQAAAAADDAYVFGIGAALLSGLVAMRLAPRRDLALGSAAGRLMAGAQPERS